MNIWHVGSSPEPQAVDGVNTTVWLTAIEQSQVGHNVSLILEREPSKEAQDFADKHCLCLSYIPSNMWRYETSDLGFLMLQFSPDIVHMHSVFLPKQAFLAKYFDERKVPYVVTPHGGLDSKHGRWKKWLYSFLVERQRFQKSAAITVVTPKEEETVRAFVPNYTGIVRWIPNPIRQTYAQSWQGRIERKRIIYLGRFDVFHKGIDILVEIAKFLPSDIEVHLYGTRDRKTERWLNQLEQSLPENVCFHKPVFGEEKLRILVEASLYIQVSRWEVFGLAIAEAMYLGTPCAIASTLNFAEIFSEYNLGFVLPADPQAAADSLSKILSQPEQLRIWSENAQTYAKENFQAKEISARYLELYKEVLSL
jgi:glycosyltransferase involved in cell wall biosynthesis